MEEFVKKIVKHYLDKNYPGFVDVLVTKEQITPSRFKSEDNLQYMIFCLADFKTYIMNHIEIWSDIKEKIKDKVRVNGINNPIRIYLEYTEEE